MANLTAEKVNGLADNFSAMAQAVGEYRYKNYENLSESQNQQIKDLQATILDIADRLYTLSAVLVMEDIETSLATIDNITNELRETYKTLLDFQKAINVAGAIVALGSSILSGKPASIVQSIDSLVKIWNA